MTLPHKSNIVVSIDDADSDNLVLAERLLALGITPLFYIQTMTHQSKNEIISLSLMGCEIGSHTMTHPGDIKRLNIEEQRAEIEISKRQIEEWTGKQCDHFAYPRGRHNDETVALVKQAGYLTARTTHVLHTDWQDDFRMPSTIHVTDVRREYEGRPWESMAQFYWDHCKKSGGVFHIWGHAAEMKREGTTDAFINFLKSIL